MNVYLLFLSVVTFFFSISLSGLNVNRQVLYIADDNEIRSLDPGMPNWVYEQTFQGDANVRIDAMDLHIKTNRIFWTNWHTSGISSFQLPSTSSSSSSGTSSNSHRNTRQSEGTVTNLAVHTSFACYLLNIT